MEGHSNSPVKSSSPLAQDPDSAIGTMSDLTPEDEKVLNENNFTNEKTHSTEVKDTLVSKKLYFNNLK